MASTRHHSPIPVIAAMAILAFTAGAAGCSGLPKLAFPGVYRIDIPQGNIITQEMVDQLRPGLTKQQVNFIMGTPLVRDTFDQDRWDYVYNYQPGGGVRVQERLTLYFENNRLVRFEGDFEQTPENAQFGQEQEKAEEAQPSDVSLAGD